ncbi:UNVERIFIED_CONTAM: hypothetical protein O8I53_11335 [Campylobacter lari]
MYERDPEVCAEKIAKRRKLLEKLHNENMYELAHPAYIREEDKPFTTICEDPFCKASKVNENLRPEEIKEKKKQYLIIKTLSVLFSLSLIAVCVLIAVLIPSLVGGN